MISDLPRKPCNIGSIDLLIPVTKYGFQLRETQQIVVSLLWASR